MKVTLYVLAVIVTLLGTQTVVPIVEACSCYLNIAGNVGGDVVQNRCCQINVAGNVRSVRRMPGCDCPIFVSGRIGFNTMIDKSDLINLQQNNDLGFGGQGVRMAACDASCAQDSADWALWTPFNGKPVPTAARNCCRALGYSVNSYCQNGQVKCV